MTWNGTVVGGAVVLEGTPPPEGAKVTVSMQESEENEKPTLAGLLEVSGTVPLPSDFAEQHDHYLHGSPKR